MSTQARHAPFIVIGAGPAGYTAAIYAARAMLSPMVIEGIQPGGQLTITTDVENYPGFAEAVQGPWLMEQMRAQAANVGAEMISDHIRELDLSQRPFRMVGDSGQVYLADTAVLATGAQAKWLGLDSETRLRGAGVSACATCDGFFYRGKTVAVVGGGNTAAEEALFLTNFAEEVILIHRRDELRADKLNQSRLFKNPKIRFVWNSEVQEVLGGGTPEGVVGVNVRNRQTGEVSTIDAEGLFIAIGHQPATELVKGQVAMKDGDYVITEPDSTVTSVPGFYAAGDVTDDIYRQAVTAAGMGCMAALEAERFLAAQGDEAEDMPQAAE